MFSNTEILTLHYNTNTGQIQIHWMPHFVKPIGDLVENVSADSIVISARSQKPNMSDNLFDRFFGKQKYPQITIIKIGGGIEDTNQFNEFYLNYRLEYITNFYYTTLKALFVRVSYVNMMNYHALPIDEIRIKNRHKYYKELKNDYDSFDREDFL